MRVVFFGITSSAPRLTPAMRCLALPEILAGFTGEECRVQNTAFCPSEITSVVCVEYD